jgi:hypothetical protein
MAKTDEQEIAELQRLNDKLSESLERCRRILADCQSKLAANSNDSPFSRREREGQGQRR